MDPDQLKAFCGMWLPLLERASSDAEAVDVLKCTRIGLSGDPKDLWLWLLAQSNDVVDALQSAVLGAAVTAASALTDDREIQLVVHRAVHGFGTLNVHLVPAVFELCMLKAPPPSATRCMTMAVNVLRKAKNVWVRHDSELAATDTEHDSDRQILYDNMVALVVAVLRRVLAAVETADPSVNDFVVDNLDTCEPYYTSVRACLVRVLVDMLRVHTVVPVPGRPLQFGLVALTQLASTSADAAGAGASCALQQVMYTTLLALSKDTNPWNPEQTGAAWVSLSELRDATEVITGLMNNEMRDKVVQNRSAELRCIVARQARYEIMASAMEMEHVGPSDAETELYEPPVSSDSGGGSSGHAETEPHKPCVAELFWDQPNSIADFMAVARCSRLAERTDVWIVILALGLDTTMFCDDNGTTLLQQRVFQPSDTPEQRKQIEMAVATMTAKFQNHPIMDGATLHDYADRCVRIVMELLLDDDNAYAVFYYAVLNIVTKGDVPGLSQASAGGGDGPAHTQHTPEDVQRMLGPFACMHNHNNTVGIANNRDSDMMCVQMERALAAVGDATGTAMNIVVNLGFGETHISARKHHEHLHKANTRVITCEFNNWVMGLGDHPRAMQIMRESVLVKGLHILPFNIETMRLPHEAVLHGCTMGITSWYANAHVDYTEVLKGSPALARVFCLCYNQDISGMEPRWQSAKSWPRVVTNNELVLNRIESRIVRKRDHEAQASAEDGAPGGNEHVRKKKRKTGKKNKTRAEMKLGL